MDSKQLGRYEKYMNELGRNRQPAMLRSLDDMFAKAPPHTVKLAAGFPHPEIFPFDSVSVTMKDGYSFCLKDDELNTAIQYQLTSGYPPLRKQLKDLVRHLHKPPYDAETILVSGHQDGVCKVFEMMLEPGKPVFIADPTYASGIDMMRPYKPAFYPIQEDEDGIVPELLRNALKKSKEASGGDPKKEGNLLYLVPNGSNPSGTVISTERKKEIYKLACEYDLIILEDDPYYFYNYQEEIPISFLSLDTEQRVVRIEGLSKVMTPGFRIAMATGPLPLIQKMEWHMQITVGHIASLPMVIVHKVLTEWGIEGFMKQVERVRTFFHKRMLQSLALAKKHLTGLVKFNVPKAGMFFWMEILGVEDAFPMVMGDALTRGVMMVPGSSFFVPREGNGPPKNCVRVSFSLIDIEQMDRVSFMEYVFYWGLTLVTGDVLVTSILDNLFRTWV